MCIITSTTQQAGLQPISYSHTLVIPSLFLPATRDAASRLHKDAAAAAAAAERVVRWRPLLAKHSKRQSHGAQLVLLRRSGHH